MKIKISLNSKSLERAVEKVNKMKKEFPLMKQEFLEKCAWKIAELANENLYNWDIGENLKTDIANSWFIIKEEDKLILRNNQKRAYFVEFGTGIVGQEQPHEKAVEQNYKYNEEGFKDSQGRWTFYQNLQDLDLPTKYSEDRIYFNEPRRNSERMLIRTSGAPASMFVFNAVMEFKEKLYAKKIWEEIKEKYWG